MKKKKPRKHENKTNSRQISTLRTAFILVEPKKILLKPEKIPEFRILNNFLRYG